MRKLGTKEALRNFKEGKLVPGKVFIYGDEYFLTEQFLKLLKGSFEVEEFFVDEGFPGNLYQSAIPSLFSEDVLPILKGAEKLPSFLRSENDRKRFLNFVKSRERLVIVAGSLDRKKLSGSFFSSLLKLVDFVVQSYPMSEKEKIGLVVKKFKKSGKNLSPELAGFIVSSVQGEVQDLKVETDKLLSYPGDLTKEVVEELLFSVSTASIFEVINYILVGDKRGFLSAVESLFSSGVDPLQLLSLLQTQVRQLITLKLGGNVRLPKKAVQEYSELLRRVSLPKLYLILKFLCEVEFSIKSGIFPKEDALRRLSVYI